MLNFKPKTNYIGQIFEYLTTCLSTNDIAAEKIHNSNNFDGFVILTDHQTGGRGQRGTIWESKPKQNLLFSLIINSSFLALDKQFYLSMTVANALIDTLSFYKFKDLKIKWPNDIYIDEKKIGGVLIENSIQGQHFSSSIIGIGINNQQTVFENPRATSLITNSPLNPIENIALLSTFCEIFEQKLETLKCAEFDKIKLNYLENLFWYKQKKQFKAQNEIFFGIINDIAPNGNIIISTQKGLEYYDIKEIEFLFA